jgi:PA26 p53-induced protein (sestrin)
VEFPSLVNEGPSWIIPISEIIGFKTDHHKESITIRIPDRYVSDVSDDSDIEFGSRPRNNDSLEGYSYYTSPDATPRPQFSTPAIPINAPPRSRSRTQQRHHISRNTSQESFAQSYTSSHKSAERKYPHQPHASSEIREFEIGSFVTHGRITNYAKILFFMPKYLLCSSTCHEKLISSAKGVSRSNKTYIALVATAEMGCQYFVSYLASKFVEVGGDSVWLKGLEYTPGYIQRIAEFNRKLVQEPWALTKKDVNALTETRDFDGEDEEGWNLNEVAQIATILAMFHCQSAIALGAGVVCEADVFGGTFWRRISKATDDDTLTADSEDRFTGGKKRQGHTVNGGRQEIIDKLRLRMLTSGHISPDMSFDSFPTLHRESIRDGKNTDRRVEAIFREILGFDHTNGVANEDKVVSPTISPSNSSTTPRPKAPQSECESPMNPVIEDLSRFTLDGIATSTIFPSAPPPLQYCWDETKHLLQHLLPDLSSSLDRRFHLSPTPSFLRPRHPYNDDDDDDDPLDITPFKEALHYYSLAILGVIKDTYNYNLIHKFLGDDLRAFVRRLCLDSKGITKQEWGMMKRLGFLSAEIVEIGMLVSEARFMGVLMYVYKVIGSL